MKELRSTEILDKEIEEDARKKAERLLATADNQCAQIFAETGPRIEKIREEKKAAYAEQIDRFTRNAQAALPLEQVCFLVSFESDTVTAAINDYLKTLPEKKRLSIIGKMLDQNKEVFAGKKITASTFGIKAETAQKLFKNKLGIDSGSCTEISFEKTGELPVEGITIREGVIVENEDKSIRLRATLDEKISEILDNNRFELVSALFGRRLPE
jgi:V/A-type H+-transporting ATPase subunit E